jgi:hypothetical protein
MKYLGRAAVVAAAFGGVSACASTTFGRVVTEVTVSPDR